MKKRFPRDHEPLCPGCGRGFFRSQGFCSFLREEDFPDGYDELGEDNAFLQHEDQTTAARFARYFIPLLRSWGVRADDPILCLGCGSGADVRVLRQHGFRETYGIDLGWRAYSWARNGADPHHLFITDGNAMPFVDRTFQIIISLGVIEHVGALGSSAELQPDYDRQRLAFLREAIRVLDDTGKLILSCPHRLFPIDFQHNISRQPFLVRLAIKTGVSLHSPWDPFLLSYADISRYARLIHPDIKVSPLPLDNYLGLHFYQSPLLRPLSGLCRGFFRVLDRLPRPLRTSFLNPYMLCELSRQGLRGRRYLRTQRFSWGISP